MSITDTQFDEGILAYKSGDYETAEHAFSKVLEAEPHSSEALLNLGNVYFQTNQLDKAEEQWLKGLEINPGEEKLYLNLGNLYHTKNAHTKAIYYWEIFKQLKPKHPNVYLNLGIAYEAIQKIPQAFDHYNQFCDLSNEKASIRLQARKDQSLPIATHNIKIAVSSMKQGKLKKARKAFDASILLMPSQPKVYKQYATVLYKLGDYPEALKWFEVAHEQAPTDSSILINLGVLYEKRQNDICQAMWAYEKAVSSNPNGISGKIKHHLNALWKNFNDEAIDVALQKIQTKSALGEYYEATHLATRLYELASSKNHALLPRVKEIYELLMRRKDPLGQAATMAFALAEDYKDQGQFDKALPLYERYLELTPAGDKAPEVELRINEIKKTITSVVGTMMDMDDDTFEEDPAA